MALTKNMSYDHPAYTSVHAANLGSVGAGSAANSQRFVAHTTLVLKAVNYSTVTAGTGAATDTKLLLILRGTNTATQTQALATSTAAFFNYNIPVTAAISTMTQGDVAWVQKGTDATEVGGAVLEYVIAPGASVTP